MRTQRGHRAVPPVLQTHAADPAVEKVRRAHADAIDRLTRMPLADHAVIKDVPLEDGVETPVSHGLGRPVVAIASPPRGASTTGRIEEVQTNDTDKNAYVVLKATGFGATVFVDILVF